VKEGVFLEVDRRHKVAHLSSGWWTSSPFNATRNDKQTRLAFRMALSDDGREPEVELALV
jgi:hypothetical protein